MAQIKVSYSGITQEIDEISALGGKLRSCSQQIINATRILKGNSERGISVLCRRLDTLNENVLAEAAKMDSLSAALEYILTLYQNAERKMLQGLENGTVSGGSASETVTREQEKNRDLYMQNQIFNLLKNDAYSKKTWTKASVEERKAMLNAYLAELMVIYGVSVHSTIHFQNLGGSTRGQYSPSANEVIINEDYLSRKDSYQIMQTMIHEMRHAYQHAAINDPDSYQVSPETIAQWKDNFEHYKSTSNGATYPEYVSQPIEWDAKNFAKQYNDLTNANPEYRGSW